MANLSATRDMLLPGLFHNIHNPFQSHIDIDYPNEKLTIVAAKRDGSGPVVRRDITASQIEDNSFKRTFRPTLLEMLKELNAE